MKEGRKDGNHRNWLVHFWLRRALRPFVMTQQPLAPQWYRVIINAAASGGNGEMQYRVINEMLKLKPRVPASMTLTNWVSGGDCILVGNINYKYMK